MSRIPLGLWAFALVTAACASPCRSPADAPAFRAPRTLVLYDDAGRYAWLGELYGAGAGVLASHFGAWHAEPVSGYRADEMAAYDAVIYVGSTYAQPLPTAFTDDVLAEKSRVVWVAENLWQLARRTPDFAARYGFVAGANDDRPFHVVTYKDVHLTRDADPTPGLTAISNVAPAIATVLGTAKHDDGTSVPWAIRSGRLTYLAENPLSYATLGDRLLAFSDLLFDVLAPETRVRHRAVIRIEDVTPRSSPAQLRAVADALAARGAPFSVAVVPIYVNPNTGERVRLADAPEVVAAIRYMLARGGSLVLHGYTHQYSTTKNPFSGVSGDDFEFYRAHIDANRVILDGPVAEDSRAWVDTRISNALAEVDAAALPRPRVFEYPHYAGSPDDSRAIARRIPIAFQRETLFSGALAGRNEDTTRPLGLPLPYVVDDLYGWRVIPENLGNYVPESILGRAPETPEVIVDRARALTVVRDGVAGFFFHPIYDCAVLERIVDGIAALGYSFVSVDTLESSARSTLPR